MVAGLCNKEIIAPFTFKGTMDTDLLNSYLTIVLLPLLCTGCIIVMDNAPYHISDETRELIEDAGGYLIYLPPYSPELNKIENYWAILKKYLRKLLFLFDSIDEALFYIFNHVNIFNTLLGA